MTTIDSSTMTVRELKTRLDKNDGLLLLDVREPLEYRICNIGGKLLPLGELPTRLDELDPGEEIAVICHHGRRSNMAVEFLRRSGFQSVRNVAGGIDAWAKEIDPSLPRY